MDDKLKDLESLAKGMESNVYTSCVINIFPQDIENIRWAIETIKSHQKEVDKLHTRRIKELFELSEMDEEKLMKYEQVLKFYADKEHYKVFGNRSNGEYEYIHIVDMDEGEKARKALNI